MMTTSPCARGVVAATGIFQVMSRLPYVIAVKQGASEFSNAPLSSKASRTPVAMTI
jgi:hypothetical protein